MVTLSPDQQLTLESILTWFKKAQKIDPKASIPQPEGASEPFITLGGYAGTGKTTLIAVIRQELDKLDKDLKVGFASYTGKAARVLKTKLTEQKVILPKDIRRSNISFKISSGFPSEIDSTSTKIPKFSTLSMFISNDL